MVGGGDERSMLNEWRMREDGAGGPGRIATTV